jgi:pimeloyl-ACP methyl ester carboxylesterase
MNTQTMPARAKAAAAAIEPYTICVSPFSIEDLRERLGRARWPDEIEDSGWQYGANKAFLEELCTHWGHGFDWKEQEEELNSLHHYCAGIDGFGLHFIHEKGEGETRVPLLLIHGWPDSFARFVKLIPLLTRQGADGFSFDVVVPSIPGFGFSEKPKKPGMGVTRIAELFAGLMKKLGYDKFLVHGGDWGSSIAEQLAIGFPDKVTGLHLTDVPFTHGLLLKDQQMADAESDYFQRIQQWRQKEGAYGLVQATKPQTLAYAINDSPIGLAAWIIDKFYAWTDHPGDLEKVYTRDELLVNLTIYWVTQTAGSSFRLYYETMHVQPKTAKGKIGIPAAFCIAPKDARPPREYAERFFNVFQWTELEAGGHFLAMEKPGALADDLFKFAGGLDGAPKLRPGSRSTKR